MVLNITKKKNFIVVAIIFATFICSFSFGISSVSAYSATISTSNSIELDIAPTGNGTSIHSESINVQSDCRAGYNLTIATPEGSSLYVDGDNTKTASFTAVDGTSALSSSNNTNKWGYTLTSNPTSSTIFSPLSTTASILKTSSQTASPSSDINDTFSINYGAKVDSTITPGTYQMANNGAIVYYLTMDTTCTQYTVSFNPNGGTGTINNQPIGTGEPTKLTSSESLTAPTGGSYTDADNNTITGDPDKLWTFWGWNTSADGTGDWYKDKEAVTDLTNVGTTITLYAQWKQPTLADMIPGTPVSTEKVIDHDLMQDMKPEVCWNSTTYSTDTNSSAHTPYDSSTNPGGYHTITLKDYRGKVTTGSNPESPEQYNVSKLADGLCWMTTNLNLGRSGTDGPNGDGTVTLTSDDTDLAADATFTLPAHDTNASNTSTNARIRTTNTSGTNANGTYYSWAAAVANTTSISTNPTTSICPKNWDLPASSQYTTLNTKSSYSSTNQTTLAPSSFLINGGFTNGSSFNQTSYSHFWTSTSYDISRAYGARVNGTTISISSSTGTTYGGNKYYRKNLRCVASQGIVTVNYDGNGSDGGSMTNQINVEISSSSLTSNAFTRTHYSFKNWNTAANGSGTTIANTAALSSLGLKPGDTVTLYAQWTPQRQIIYNDNCSYNNAGCATNEDTTGTSSWTNAGSSITLGNDTYFTTRTGYAITSWNTARDGSGTSYNVSSSYTVPSDLSFSDQVTLYAMWSPALTINFNSNGGTGTMTAQLIPENTTKALKSNSFTAPSGNYFIGWMTEESRATNTVVYANQATYAAPTTVTPGDSVTLYAKWGPKYTIVYNGNNATGGSMISDGTELKHTNINEGTTINYLYAPNYYKTNYGFVGWSPSSTATVGGTDPIYGPNESISAPAYDKYGQEISGTKTVTLYAIWLQADTTKTMQAFTLSDCQNMTQVTYNSSTKTITAPAGSVIALKDQRDGNVYTVARLADGNCWMIENLRLEAAGTVGNNQTNPSVTNESLSQGYGGVFTGLDSSENSNFTNTTNATPNSLYNSTNIVGTDPNYRFPRYNNNNTNTTLTASYNGTGSSTYYSWYSYGNYYTWAAAMANTTHYTSYSGDSGSDAAGTSICPTNWTLPFGANRNLSGSFYYLDRQMGKDASSKEWRSFPNNYLYSGELYDSSIYDRSSGGHYWSKSVYNRYYSYNLDLGYSGLSLYQNNVKYNGFSVRCLVDNTYTIRYDGNNATGGSMISDGTELKHRGLSGGETIDLYPSNYYRTGYGFAGWSTDPDAWTHFTDNDNTNDPVIYGPMETITAPAHPGHQTMTFYAVWVPAEEDNNNNPIYLQDFDGTSCSNLTSTTYDSTTETITANKNSIVALTDKRDGNVYTIARLADGNCWMTENLRLDAANTVGNNQYDSSVTNESLAQGYGDVFIGLDSSENSNFTGTTNATPNNMYNSSNITGTYSEYRFPRYNNNNINPSFVASYDGGNSSTPYSWYSYGNYYTWAAAMANTYNLSGASGSESAGTSLCPTNWALPTSGSTSKDFGVLSQSYDGSGNNQNSPAGTIMSKRFRAFPNNFIYSGSFNDSSAINRNRYGIYWSRSRHSSDNYAYFLYVYPTILRPSGSNSKSEGYSIRCLVASPHTVTVNLGQHVQSVSFTDSSSNTQTVTTNGGTVTLKEAPYTISATYDNGYEFNSWSTTGGRLDSTTSANTTYSVISNETLSITAKETLYTIVYNGNNATGGSMISNGTELKHTNIKEGDTVNLYAPNYYKTNYGFVGWSPSSTATVGGTDPIYGPNESISAPNYNTYGEEISGTKTITLYAIWLEADTNETMQTFTLSDCQNLSQTTFNSTTGVITAPAGSVIALKDQRDGNVYTVARLADGNCWMTENLRLESTNTVGNNQYDSSVTNESLSQGYGGVFTGLDSTENDHFDDVTTATPNNLYNSTNITGNSPSCRFPRYNNNNTNTNLTASYSGNGNTTYYSWYSYGNYYTWVAAMANTTYYYSATGSPGSESAGTSICPTNWTLPTSGSTIKDFGNLSQQYGGTGDNQLSTETSSVMSKRFRNFPNNFLISGYFNTSSASNRSSYGHYWSKSTKSDNTSYNLTLSSSSLSPSNSSLKYYGLSIRCLIPSS